MKNGGLVSTKTTGPRIIFNSVVLVAIPCTFARLLPDAVPLLFRVRTCALVPFSYLLSLLRACHCLSHDVAFVFPSVVSPNLTTPVRTSCGEYITTINCQNGCD